MKKIIILLALAFCLNVKAQYVTIPDANFASYLQTIIPSAMNGNQMDTTNTLVTTTTQTINVSNKGISDLTGISYFKSLQYLNCRQNNLGTILLPSTLKYLDCSMNGGLNISTLPDSLHYFNCTSSCWNPPIYFPVTLDTIIAVASGWSSIPTLPGSLVYLDVNADFIECFPPFPPSVQYADISGNFCYCLPNYPMGLIVDYNYPPYYGNYPLCGPNPNGCPVSPSCTSTPSYTLIADAAPHMWDAYPTYPANMDSVTWYWGDGTDTTALYPSHTYSVAGKYNICVTIITANGCTSTYCQNDSVYRLANNNNTLSNMVYINVINSAAGISKIANKNSFTFYPNPTSDQFFIDANTTDKLNVDLFDVNGRHVFSASVMDKSNINVSTLDNGTYTLTIKTADRVINKKLVILR